MVHMNRLIQMMRQPGRIQTNCYNAVVVIAGVISESVSALHSPFPFPFTSRFERLGHPLYTINDGTIRGLRDARSTQLPPSLSRIGPLSIQIQGSARTPITGRLRVAPAGDAVMEGKGSCEALPDPRRLPLFSYYSFRRLLPHRYGGRGSADRSFLPLICLMIFFFRSVRIRCLRYICFGHLFQRLNFEERNFCSTRFLSVSQASDFYDEFAVATGIFWFESILFLEMSEKIGL